MPNFGFSPSLCTTNLTLGKFTHLNKNPGVFFPIRLRFSNQQDCRDAEKFADESGLML